MKKPANQRVKRRKFLKGTAVASAAVGTGALSAQTLADVANDQPDTPEPTGYRETEHIRAYYRLARF